MVESRRINRYANRFKKRNDLKYKKISNRGLEFWNV